jgi:cytosine/adenosine deaminase-related metal-dependent hydrolase
VPRVLSADWVLPIEAPPIADGAVELDEGRIVAVGTADELGAGERFEGAAILPGLVNAHSHLEYSVYVGFGDGLSFAPWLDLHVARKGRIGWDDHVSIARLGAAQCLASGVTTVADASYSGAAAVACAELGLTGLVHLEVFGIDPVSALASFHRKRARVEDCFSERLRLGVSPHTPYTCSTEVYAACAELGLPVATHFNESAGEVEWLTRGEGPLRPFADLLVPPDGRTGIRRLAAAGLLGPEVVAAHCVKVDGEEIDLLAGHGVSVAHCPRSNAQLGCGIAPVAELRAAGVAVGVGTDSPASTPSFDVFEELRAVVAGARLRAERAEAFSADEALELATLGSARALGLENEVGSLVPGKRADLTVVSLEETPFLPWEDPAAAVVLGGAPERVLLTIVDGETRYERGGFEWHELLRDATSARSRMLGRGRPVAEPA